MSVNIFEAGAAILATAGAVIVSVLAKMAVKEIRHPQREVQLPLPESKSPEEKHELQHVG